MNAAALKMLVCLTAFVVGAEDPNQASISESSQEITEKANQLQQQMRMLQDSAMDPNSTLQSNSLRSLIDQIQTLKLPSEAVNAAAPAAVVQMPAQTLTKKAEAKAVSLADIDAVKEPFNAIAAADALYRMGDYVRAMRFYDIVIAKKSESNILPRQWAMYQAANCMRYQDVDKAMELYNGLLAEYPNNGWAAAAMAQKHALEWLKKNKAELEQRTQIDDPNGR